MTFVPGREKNYVVCVCIPVLTTSQLVYLCLRLNVSIKHSIKTRTVMFDMHFKKPKRPESPSLIIEEVSVKET